MAHLYASKYEFREFKVKLRVCPVCGKNPIISVSGKKCRSCAGKATAKIRGFSVDRGKMLVMLETGKYSLEEVASKYDLTRERVRQIWKKNTGSGYRKHIDVERKLRVEKEEKFLASIKFVCIRCKKKIDHREGKFRSTYCKDCWKILKHGSRRNYRIIKVCQTCGVKFHPFSNYNSPSQTSSRGIFCSHKCYRKSPTFLNMIARGVARKFDKEKIIDLVCGFIKKNGRLPRFREINTKDFGVSNGTVYRYFKSLSELRNQAYLKLERISSKDKLSSGRKLESKLSSEGGELNG